MEEINMNKEQTIKAVATKLGKTAKETGEIFLRSLRYSVLFFNCNTKLQRNTLRNRENIAGTVTRGVFCRARWHTVKITWDNNTFHSEPPPLFHWMVNIYTLASGNCQVLYRNTLLAWYYHVQILIFIFRIKAADWHRYLSDCCKIYFSDLRQILAYHLTQNFYFINSDFC